MKLWHPQSGATGGCAWLVLLVLLGLFVIAYLYGKSL